MTSHRASENLSNEKTEQLLRSGLTVPVRPIDALLDRLGTVGGWGWLESNVHDEFTDEELSIVQSGGDESSDHEARLIEVKEAAKTRVADAPTEQRALVAMAVYCLAVASGLVHHGELYSTRPAHEWSELFADLAGLASSQWRPMLFQAAEAALLRSTS